MAEFNWNAVSDMVKIAVPHVDAVAVYSQSNDSEIVIRQRSPTGEDDSVIVVPAAYIRPLIQRLEAIIASGKMK